MNIDIAHKEQVPRYKTEGRLQKKGQNSCACATAFHSLMLRLARPTDAKYLFSIIAFANGRVQSFEECVLQTDVPTY